MHRRGEVLAYCEEHSFRTLVEGCMISRHDESKWKHNSKAMAMAEHSRFCLCNPPSLIEQLFEPWQFPKWTNHLCDVQQNISSSERGRFQPMLMAWLDQPCELRNRQR